MSDGEDCPVGCRCDDCAEHMDDGPLDDDCCENCGGLLAPGDMDFCEDCDDL
jgi:hypothetical protein